jgi:HK97 family phage major capsid protein
MNALQELEATLDARRKDWQSAFAITQRDGASVTDIDTALGDLARLNSEMDALGKRADSLKSVAQQAAAVAAQHAAYNTPVAPAPFAPTGPAAQAPQRPGELFTASAGFKAFRPGVDHDLAVQIPGIDVKTVMQETTPGFAPPNNRGPVVIYTPQRRLVVSDLIPSDPTEVQVVKYMEETTFTNAAAMRLEGNAAGEAALAFTQRSQNVEILSVFLPVTNEQLEDVPQIQSIIDNRLTLMIGLQEETQLLTGNGSSPNLQGILTKSGIGTQALGGDTTPDAIFKAMTLVRTSGASAWGSAEPSGLVMNPTDWQNVRLLKTTIGSYIWGDPDQAGPERFWGLPAAITNAITAGTALVGDFRMFAHVSRRKGLTVAVSNSHSDYFTKGIQAIRMDERLSLEIYRAGAFCQVTGL